MIDDTFEEIEDASNPLKDKLPMIIEYFVDFYGEDNRERITQRLNDAIYVFVERGEKNSLAKFFKERRDEIALNFKIALELYSDYDVVNEVIAQSDYFIKIISKVEKWRKNITKEDVEEVYSLLDMIRDKQLKVESPKQLEKMLKDKNSAKKIYEFLGNLYSIYELDYKEDMEHLLSEEDRLNNGSQAEKVKEIQKQFENDCKELISIKLIALLSISMDEKNILQLNKIVPVVIDNVLKDPKFYTHYDTVRYSDAFAQLAKMSKNKLKINDVETLIDNTRGELKNSILELQKKADIRISKTLSNLKGIISKIVDEVVEGEVYIREINNFFKNSSSTTAGFNITGVSRQDPNKTVCICCNSTVIDLFDDVVVHELGHIVAADVKHVSGKSYTYKSGITSELRAEPNFSISNTPKSYKILNEVFNEYFSSLICDKMYDDDFIIGINGCLGKGVSYRRAFPLIKDFMNENLDFLKKCYINNDYVALDKKFGRDNLRALAKVLQRRIDIKGRVDKSALRIMKNEIAGIKNKMKDFKTAEQELEEEKI